MLEKVHKWARHKAIILKRIMNTRRTFNNPQWLDIKLGQVQGFSGFHTQKHLLSD